MVSFLSLPAGQNVNNRKNFIDWVDKYMEGHSDQPYQYRGKDLYAARCALLHTFGAEAKAHKDDQDIFLIGYHNGGKHALSPDINPRLLILGTSSLTNDFICGVEVFLKDAKKDENLWKQIWERLLKIHQFFPIANPKEK